MIKSIKLISMVLVIGNSSCQPKPDLNKFSNVLETLPPPRKIEKDNLVGFACFYSGSSSDAVNLFSKLLKSKNYEVLRRNLTSNSAAQKYLATVSCEKLQLLGLIKLNDQEKNQIAENKQSKETVAIYSGCTEYDEITLEDMFIPGKNFCSKELEYWFNEDVN